MTRPKVPTRQPTTDQSLAELELVFERLMYVIQWIADTPTHLVDGQHHEVLREAVAALEERIKGVLHDGAVGKEAGDWQGAFSRRYPPGMSHGGLEQHGLTGPEWVLKFEAFDRHFRGFLDKVALLESRYQGLAGQVDTLSSLVDLRRDARGALGMGETIADSALEALSEIPGAKALIGTVKEAAGAVKSLMNE